MKKIICLLGKSCAGKDTAVTSLQELINLEQKLNADMGYDIAPKKFKKAVSYTTRPMRNGETDGLEYHFVDVKKFENIRNSVGFIEETSYEVNGETWHYGFAKNEFDEDTTYIMIANPRGLEAFLHSEFKDLIIPVLLECSNKERKRRYFQRDKNNSNLEKQWRARHKQDLIDFKDVMSLLTQFQYFSIVNTEKLSKKEVANFLEGLL